MPVAIPSCTWVVLLAASGAHSALTISKAHSVAVREWHQWHSGLSSAPHAACSMGLSTIHSPINELECMQVATYVWKSMVIVDDY